MFMRISWGRVNPGQWEEYERAFLQALADAGPIDGLVRRTVSRDPRRSGHRLLRVGLGSRPRRWTRTSAA